MDVRAFVAARLREREDRAWEALASTGEPDEQGLREVEVLRRVANAPGGADTLAPIWADHEDYPGERLVPITL